MRQPLAKEKKEKYEADTKTILADLEKKYKEFGGGVLAARDIFSGAKTVTEALEKMEAHAKKHQDERSAPKSGIGFLPMLSIASLIFSKSDSGLSASEKTLKFLREEVRQPGRTIIDLVQQYKNVDMRYAQQDEQEAPAPGRK